MARCDGGVHWTSEDVVWPFESEEREKCDAVWVGDMNDID